MALLRAHLIKAKPKAVRFSDFFDKTTLTQPELIELREIITSISQGSGVPSKYYRSDVGRTPDRLLKDEGIMHLHLGGKDSDRLVYLMQFEEEVVLLLHGPHVYLEEPLKRVLVKNASKPRVEATARDAAAQKAKVLADANAEKVLKTKQAEAIKNLPKRKR